MIPNPIFRNPNETDLERELRLEAEFGSQTRRSKIIFAGGILILIGFVACCVVGLPGAGVILVPIGMAMLLGAGIELLLGGLS